MTITIREHTSSKYTPRTYYNGKSAEATIALAVDLTTAGEISTKKAAEDRYLGVHLEDSVTSKDVAKSLIAFMREKNATTLNIAGNGIYTLNKYDCSQEHINQFVYEALYFTLKEISIKKIFTGGQTGVDLAGAIAANILNIDAEITFPKGFIQRGIDKVDRAHTMKEIEDQIIVYSDMVEKF